MTTPTRREQNAKAARTFKAKKNARGIIRVEIWVHRDNAEKLKKYAAKLEAETK